MSSGVKPPLAPMPEDGANISGAKSLLLQAAGQLYPAGEGETILEVMGPEGPTADCGGRGACGKCVVKAIPPENLFPPAGEEIRLLGEEAIGRGLRLACQARIKGDVTLEIPGPGVMVSSAKENLRGAFPVAPLVERRFFTVRRDEENTGAGSRDLVSCLMPAGPDCDAKKPAITEATALADISRMDFGEAELTLVQHRVKGVTAVLPGRRPKSLGVALDIGTTTVAAYLADLRRGEILTSRAAANPQARYGADVISRISYANERDDGLLILQGLVVAQVNDLIAGCLGMVGAAPDDVDEVVAVGNTTMQHLFTGLHPRSLGLWPYLPVTGSPLDLRAADLGLNLRPATNVHVFPVISGFVGGDTVGAILSQGLARRREITLLIDIGTNGELVLGNRDGLWATSCATGPALEGAHIAAGMSATAGAIDRVSINPGDFRVTCRTIGGTAPRGICGSGIIDALAEMRRTGVLLAGGRLREGLPGVSADAKGIGRAFDLIAAPEGSDRKGIAITLTDIRQVQLAKAALAAGIRILQEKTGHLKPETIILTGAFGARFNWLNAVAIGMLPASAAKTKIKVVENAAGLGAVMALLDRGKRAAAERIARRARFLELASDPDFTAAFTEALDFP